MKIKLHWKLTILFCSIMGFALIGGYISIALQLRSHLTAMITRTMTNQLALAKDLLERSLDARTDPQQIHTIAHAIGKTLDLRVTIIDTAGIVLGDADLSWEQVQTVENHGDRPEIREALTQGMGISTRFSYTVKKEMLYVAMPFRHPINSGSIRLSIPLYDIEKIEDHIRMTIIMTLIGILVLGLGIMFFVSRIISRPLIDMSRIAQDMSRGDFSRKIPFQPADEIGDLARALNRMSDEIKNTIEAIRAERTKLDLILSNMFEGVIVTDHEGKIILINPSLSKFFSIETDPNGKHPIEVIRNTTIEEVAHRVLTGTRTLITDEITLHTPDEKILTINAVPIIQDTIRTGAILVFHDITELRRLERIRRDFVANVSHELRTPIATIKGYAETLLDGALDDSNTARDFVSIIYQDSNRLANLINDLLDLSRIESEKLKLSLQPCDPIMLMQHVITLVSTLAKAKDISIELSAAGIPPIYADEERLSQVLINLLDNAIKYTPDNGHVTITAAVHGPFAQIDITDTGIGISDEDISRIFERFYRVDKARSREQGGTGLGLAIVKHIVQSHSGQIWVRSQLGAGSTFSFTIPLA